MEGEERNERGLSNAAIKRIGVSFVESMGIEANEDIDAVSIIILNTRPSGVDYVYLSSYPLQ